MLRKSNVPHCNAIRLRADASAVASAGSSEHHELYNGITPGIAVPDRTTCNNSVLSPAALEQKRFFSNQKHHLYPQLPKPCALMRGYYDMFIVMLYKLRYVGCP